MNWFSLLLEIFTAAGTVGAVIVALWLARRDDRPRINGVFMWSTATNYQPTLLVQNVGKQIAVIEVVKVYYNKKRIGEIYFSETSSLKDFVIVKAGEVKQVPLQSKWLKVYKPKDIMKPFTLKVVVIPRSGRKSISKQKYSYKELVDLFFGSGFYSET